jgi:hypothetical protein
VSAGGPTQRDVTGILALVCFYGAWVIFLLAISMLAGCLRSPTGLESDSEAEAQVLKDTARFAGALSVRVHGEVTDRRYDIPAGTGGCPKGGASCYATGWYQSGVAWYYRPGIASAWDIGGSALIRDIAAHETCHAIESGHNPLHVACIRSLGAVPTYDPATIGGALCPMM